VLGPFDEEFLIYESTISYHRNTSTFRSILEELRLILSLRKITAGGTKKPRGFMHQTTVMVSNQILKRKETGGHLGL
jgi:hypothetical protein